MLSVFYPVKKKERGNKGTTTPDLGHLKLEERNVSDNNKIETSG